MATGAPQKAEQQEIVVTTVRTSPDHYGWLPCRVSLEVPVDSFTVADLLRIEVGSVIGTSLQRNSDIPLHVNGVPVARVQFEAINDRLAVRITELE